MQGPSLMSVPTGSRRDLIHQLSSFSLLDSCSNRRTHGVRCALVSLPYGSPAIYSHTGLSHQGHALLYSSTQETKTKKPVLGIEVWVWVRGLCTPRDQTPRRAGPGQQTDNQQTKSAVENWTVRNRQEERKQQHTTPPTCRVVNSAIGSYLE